VRGRRGDAARSRADAAQRGVLARADQAVTRSPADPSSLARGTALGLAEHGFHAERHREYLADVRETLPLYVDQRVAHPGWLLRDANSVLSRNVELGPWIHVESVAQHHGVARDGDRIGARAEVTREWEHKGHRFVELDVVVYANRSRPLARIKHTAIYRPRRAR
jgi:hypothetical protein